MPLDRNLSFSLLFWCIFTRYSYSWIPNCCPDVKSNGYFNTIQCVNSTNNPLQYRTNLHGPTLSVIVVTRATKDIHPYAAYSYFLQYQYALSRGYNLLQLFPDSSVPDYRYHRKIAPLLDAMEEYKFSDYFVWIDSDLIVLDFSLKIEEIASQHDKAHIIFSRDVSNLVNTGCIVVKNTNWSRTFLREWLELRTNKHILNEQIGFDYLYQVYKDRDTKLGTNQLQKIAILPSEILNSIFPAMREQLPHHKVLHMATDSELYRQTVFRTAAVNYCNAMHRDEKAPNQLGITRQFLQKTVLDLNKRSFEDIENQLKDMQPDTDRESKINDLISSYRDSISKYCYAVTYQNKNIETRGTLTLRKQAFRTIQSLVDIRLQNIAEYCVQYNTEEVDNEVTQDIVEMGVTGMSSRDLSLRSISLNERLPNALKSFKDHVKSVQNGKKLRDRMQVDELNAVVAMFNVIPDMSKASVELAFELLQSIAEMGDSFPAYGYTPLMIREEQTFLLEYILHTLDVMLVTVVESMLPSVQAMRSDFIVKCGEYCKNR